MKLFHISPFVVLALWDRLLKANSSAFDGDIQMIGSSYVRVRQQGATGKRGAPIEAWDALEAA